MEICLYRTKVVISRITQPKPINKPLMKRIFTSFMLLGALAASANATEWTEVANKAQLDQAFQNQAEGIRFTADFTVSVNSNYVINFPLQIDLNGHKVTFENKAFALINDNQLILDDLSEAKTGEIISYESTLFMLNSLATTYIKGGTYTTYSYYNPCFELYKYREMEIEGGRINASRYGRAVLNKGYVTMSGGTIVGADYGFEPVLNDGEGVFTMENGAVYAGNNTPNPCFENTYWSDGSEEEIAMTVLPEGVTDGGAIVLDSKWAIPGTYFINYHLPAGTEIQPNQTHYYTPEEAFELPECNYRNNIAFAGWATSADDTDNLLTKIEEGTAENYQLYPVWKYVGLAPDVTPDLMPEAVVPNLDETVTELSQFILYFGEGDYYVNDLTSDFGALYNQMTGVKICDVANVDINWDGEATVTLAETVTANGTYELRLPVNIIGTDDWYYSDMEEGRCNPDLFCCAKVHNSVQGTTNCITDPENGSTVKELSVIRFIFPDEEDIFMNYGMLATITNENGEVVTMVDAIDFEYDEENYNEAILYLPEPITTDGVYTFAAPEGFFQFDWWERDASALSFTWTVDTNVGIDQVENGTAVEGPAGIFDFAGRRMNVTDPSQLTPGLYIINGRKVLVK